MLVDFLIYSIIILSDSCDHFDLKIIYDLLIPDYKLTKRVINSLNKLTRNIFQLISDFQCLENKNGRFLHFIITFRRFNKIIIHDIFIYYER